MAKSKLTDDQIAEIRRLYAKKGSKKYPVKMLASMFGTSKAMVNRIVSDLYPGHLYGWAHDAGDAAHPWRDY